MEVAAESALVSDGENRMGGKAYRTATLLLCVFFFGYLFTQQDFSEPGFGWQFRFLTVWALSLSLASAFCMLRRSFGFTTRRYDVLASVTAVMNVMVLFLYWRLFFIDPALVNGDEPAVWWVEYYLHGLGPVLQIIDALFILAAFRFIIKSVLALLGVMIGFPLFSELVTAPLNAEPVGSALSGLPYPFLNDMVLGERIGFYATTMVTGLAIFAILAFIAWIARRFMHKRR